MTTVFEYLNEFSAQIQQYLIDFYNNTKLSLQSNLKIKEHIHGCVS